MDLNLHLKSVLILGLTIGGLFLQGCGSSFFSLFHSSSLNPTHPITQTWSYDSGTDASYIFDNHKIDFSNGSCKLSSSNQVDSDNSVNGFAGGTFSGIRYDSSKHALVLGNNGGCDGSLNSCAGVQAGSIYELNASWTPKWAKLVGYWPLNAPNGLIPNGSTLPGKVGGNLTTVGNGLVGTAGKLNQAVTYNDTSWHSIPNSVVIPQNSPITISFWTYVPSATLAGDVSAFTLGNLGGADRAQAHGPFVSGTFYWDYGDISAGGRVSTTYNSSYQDKWTHVVLVSSGTANTFSGIYLDGVLVASANSSSGPTQSLTGGFIGGYPLYSYGTVQSIDDFAVWTDQLSAAEVNSIYSYQSPKYSGSFTSRVMDALAPGMNWTKLSLKNSLPFLKELPGEASGVLQNETNSQYSSLLGAGGISGANNSLNGLISLWHLNETALGGAYAGADFVNSIPSVGYPATKVGTGLLNDAALFAGGFTGKGAGGLSAPLDLSATKTVTVSFWMNYLGCADPSACVILEHSPNFNVSYGFIAYTEASAGQCPANALTIGHHGNSAFNLACFPPLPLGWHHIALILDRTDVNANVSAVYYDSIPQTYTPPANPSYTNGNSETFGISTVYFLGRAANSLYTNATLDEIAVWNRVLPAAEINQLYRRGANRIKYQVRTCAASDCSDDPAGLSWKGSDGTNQSYFSELNNNSLPSSLNGDVKNQALSIAFADFPNPVGINRYFQYRAILESDDPLSTPDLKSASVDPIHYESSSPSIVGREGISATALTSLTETLGTSACASGVSYSLGLGTSPTTAIWYWWDASASYGKGAWAISDGTASKSNPTSLINANSSTLMNGAISGTVYVKAFLNSSGTSACELDALLFKGLGL